MIDDLDRALEQMLRKGLAPELLANSDITFLSPSADFPPKSVRKPAINLFLYDIRQNLDLRMNDWIVERQPDGKATQRRPPTQISCCYLISVWPDESAENASAVEHQILGELLKLFVATPTLAPEYLQGSLAGAAAAIGPATSGPGQAGPDKQQIFGGRAKLALNYAVNVGVEVTRPATVSLVTRKTLDFELIENHGN